MLYLFGRDCFVAMVVACSIQCMFPSLYAILGLWFHLTAWLVCDLLRHFPEFRNDDLNFNIYDYVSLKLLNKEGMKLNSFWFHFITSQ